mmetsp:Transcript_13650/g.23238  ORF Transcript_13650/g.23238 Transcript_13650/m.23238 type:complete len:477 (-) Transcript_13650:223-1653(-)
MNTECKGSKLGSGGYPGQHLNLTEKKREETNLSAKDNIILRNQAFGSQPNQQPSQFLSHQLSSLNPQLNVTGSVGQLSQVTQKLNLMCEDHPNMVNNLPAFYRSLVSSVKDVNGNNIFDQFELDQIVEAAMAEKIPIVSAKQWAITDQRKARVDVGKNQDEQREIASMTKMCTAYTVCRILEELGIYDIEKSKNIYLRVSRKAAFMCGTSAYLQTDNRLTLYDCMCALMLPSGNDAAIILATEFGRWLFFIGDKQKDSLLPILDKKGKINNYSNRPNDVERVIEHAFMHPNKGHEDYIEAFIRDMNRQAQKLRLKKCKFLNPHGLQQKGNHASASDIIVLTNYALKYELIAQIVRKKNYKCTVYSFDLVPRVFYWENTNRLLNAHFIGGKTGITPSAGPCLASQFKFGPYESQGVLIDSKSLEIRWREMSTILLWQFDKFLIKHKVGAYNRQFREEFKRYWQKKRELEQQLLESKM